VGAVALHGVRAGHHAVHLGVDHHAADDLRGAAFEALKKEGESGRRKITQYTRYGTLGLATFQSFGIAVALEARRAWSQPGLWLPPDGGGQPDGRHDVPDVAG
jgi:hypothetical protein